MSKMVVGVAILLFLLPALTFAAAPPAPERMQIQVTPERSLALDAFRPAAPDGPPRAAIVLFHGGGWTVGEASWIYPTARLLAEQGMVAFSVDYRLANQGNVTPFDSVADARAAVRWVRAHAADLGVDPKRIAAGGISAGGHLAAVTALLDEPSSAEGSSRPDLLVLWSAALAVGNDGWFTRLAGGRVQAQTLSPDRLVRTGLPPTIVLQGAEDSVTPASGATRFCAAMKQAGNICDLHVYPGVGHLFTRNLKQQETPDYKAIDEKIDADADKQAIQFMRQHGFIPVKGKQASVANF